MTENPPIYCYFCGKEMECYNEETRSHIHSCGSNKCIRMIEQYGIFAYERKFYLMDGLCPKCGCTVWSYPYKPIQGGKIALIILGDKVCDKCGAFYEDD